MFRERLLSAVPGLALVALNLIFRLPALLNASGVNSDAAITGLQALHTLQGETSRFLWGAGYQGTFEVWLIAAFFAIGGATPLTLMVAPLTGHLALCWVAFALMRRLLGHSLVAFVLCLPLVFTPLAVNGVVTSAPRQWSITFALIAASLILWPARRTPLRLAIALALVGFTLYLDLINVIWIPAIALLVLVVCCDPSLSRKTVDGRFAGAALGAAAGALLLVTLRQGAPQEHAAFTFSPELLERNWPLFRDVSLPWLLGAKVWMPGWSHFPDLWSPPSLVAGLQWLGAASIVLLALASAWFTSTARVKWEVKAAVWFGLTATATAIGGFLFSNWPVDLWSTRYLAPVVWSLPFSLAGLASAVRPRVFAVLLAPYLAMAALGGWLSYGSYVDGFLPRIDGRGSGRHEMALGEFLRQRGYEYGYADYWLAHRLTFLWQEKPIIAAFGVNRYPPYADRAERAAKKAYIFHPSEPRATADQVLPELKMRSGRIEVVQVAGFTVILYDES